MSAFPDPLTGLVAPIPNASRLGDNIDTDTIIPSREMRTTGRDGLADGLFAPWRYVEAEGREPNPDFALNQPEYANAAIIAGGANFGCGSSREHAVWALAEFGIRAVVAESFAPIFRSNCIRNFILPVALPRDAVERIAGKSATIALSHQQIRCGEDAYAFDIGSEAKHMLTEGLDAIDLTLAQRGAIENWLAADRAARPWIYPGNAA